MMMSSGIDHSTCSFFLCVVLSSVVASNNSIFFSFLVFTQHSCCFFVRVTEKQHRVSCIFPIMFNNTNLCLQLQELIWNANCTIHKRLFFTVDTSDALWFGLVIIYVGCLAGLHFPVCFTFQHVPIAAELAFLFIFVWRHKHKQLLRKDKTNKNKHYSNIRGVQYICNGREQMIFN